MELNTMTSSDARSGTTVAPTREDGARGAAGRGAADGRDGAAGRGGGPQRARAITVAAALVAALQVLMVLAFVVPGHDPRPNGLPVAVVGSGAGADALREQLEARDLRVVPRADRAAAVAAIEDREAYGAFLAGPRPALLVASAAGTAPAELLRGIGASAGVEQVTDVVALDADDPRGAAVNLLLLPIVVSGLLAAVLAGRVVGEVRLRDRLATAAATSVAAGLATAAVLQGVLGVLPGPYLAQAGLVALAVGGLQLVGGGLVRLLGPAGLGAGFLVFLILGMPGSGAAGAPELLPAPWAQGGTFLTPGALGTALRNVAYFDGAALGRPVAVLTGVLLAGVALQVLAARRATP